MSFLDFDFAPRGGRPTLHFCLLTQSYFVDTDWGYGTPTEGMKTMGRLAHAYHIPLTYIVTGQSAEEAGELLTQCHEEFGDEVQQQLRYCPPGATHKSRSKP
jgi:hypothetical protein